MSDDFEFFCALFILCMVVYFLTLFIVYVCYGW